MKKIKEEKETVMADSNGSCEEHCTAELNDIASANQSISDNKDNSGSKNHINGVNGLNHRPVFRKKGQVQGKDLTLNLPSADDCLLDQNTMSIIRSPMKPFYCVAIFDVNDLDQLPDLRPSDSEGVFEHSPKMSNLISYSNHDAYDGNESFHLETDEQSSFLDTKHHSLSQPGLNVLDLGSSEKPSDRFSDCDESRGARSDTVSDSLSTGSETALQAIVTENNASAHLEKSHSKTSLRDDVARAVSFAELFNLAHKRRVCHKSESYLNSFPDKSSRSPRKSVRKSKSLQNHFNHDSSEPRHKLCFEHQTTDQRKTRRMHMEDFQSIHNNDLSSSNKVVFKSKCNDNEVESCTQIVNGRWSQSSDRSSLSDISTDHDVAASGVTSTGQESTAIEQVWDTYQSPLYEGISDDPGEEKLDASGLQGDWLHLNDDSDFSDFREDSSLHCDQTLLHSDQDSEDTDVEELNHLLKESFDALNLTRLLLGQAKKRNYDSNDSNPSLLLNEPLATCDTNIKCLRDLLEAVSHGDHQMIGDVSLLSDLLRQWEEVQSEFLQLTSGQDISKKALSSDVIILMPPEEVHFHPENGLCSLDITDHSLSGSSSSVDFSSDGYGQQLKDMHRFDVFYVDKECNSLTWSTLPSIQIVFAILLLLLVLIYISVYSKCWTDMMEMKFDPRLRYIAGPPPF